MKKLLLILLLATPAMASGPKYNYADPRLDDEVNNIYNDISHVPNGKYKASSMTLQGITVDSITVNSSARIHGTSTNDNAPAGYIGEISSSAVTGVAGPANTVCADLTSITLSPGDWDISAAEQISPSSGNTTRWEFGITTLSGNNCAGGIIPDNYFTLINAVSFQRQSLGIPAWRVSISAATTYYLKVYNEWSGGSAPSYAGRISARRIR